MPKVTGEIYQLKITLRGTRPPIWRRILVPATMRLDQLHHAIQNAFGWTNSHLHEFESHGELYAPPNPDVDYFDGPEAVDERKAKLTQVLPAVKSKLKYTYDFGDSWDHTIVLEKQLAPDPAVTYPVCTAGKMRCPPEDCGGISGFYDFLEIMANPKHPEHREMTEWACGPFDADDFSVAGANAALGPTRRRLKA